MTALDDLLYEVFDNPLEEIEVGCNGIDSAISSASDDKKPRFLVQVSKLTEDHYDANTKFWLQLNSKGYVIKPYLQNPDSLSESLLLETIMPANDYGYFLFPMTQEGGEPLKKYLKSKEELPFDPVGFYKLISGYHLMRKDVDTRDITHNNEEPASYLKIHKFIPVQATEKEPLRANPERSKTRKTTENEKLLSRRTFYQEDPWTDTKQ